jgi:hypothetical protein
MSPIAAPLKSSGSADFVKSALRPFMLQERRSITGRSTGLSPGVPEWGSRARFITDGELECSH